MTNGKCLTVLGRVGELAWRQINAALAKGGRGGFADFDGCDLIEVIERLSVRSLARFGLQPFILRHAFADETPGGDGNRAQFQSVGDGSVRAKFAIAEEIRLANLPGDLRANIRQIILAANGRDALAFLDVRAKNFVVGKIGPGFQNSGGLRVDGGW